MLGHIHIVPLSRTDHVQGVLCPGTLNDERQWGSGEITNKNWGQVACAHSNRVIVIMHNSHEPQTPFYVQQIWMGLPVWILVLSRWLVCAHCQHSHLDHKKTFHSPESHWGEWGSCKLQWVCSNDLCHDCAYVNSIHSLQQFPTLRYCLHSSNSNTKHRSWIQENIMNENTIYFKSGLTISSQTGEEANL